MPLDSLMIRGLVCELNNELAQARVDKIHMPARDCVVLSMRGAVPVKLLISCGNDARVHLTDTKRENPDTPPVFCMLLRKHLSGGRVLSVSQPKAERIITLTISSATEMGDITEKKLICELTGRMTNLILIEQDGHILACMKNIGADDSPRPVQPGLLYRLPPAQGKPSLDAMGDAELAELCAEAVRSGEAAEYIIKRAVGLSPALLREAEARFRGGEELSTVIKGLVACRPLPFMVIRAGEYADISPVELTTAECRQWPGFSALLDDFYRGRANAQAIKNACGAMVKTMQTAKNRLERKLAGQRQELAQARAREELKAKADLITANLHAIKPGDDAVTVTDYFDPELRQTTISLDGTLTPQQNAQRLYKKYARMKNAEQVLGEQVELGESELGYIENVLYSIAQASDAREIDEIKNELVAARYIKAHGKTKPKAPAFSPRKYVLCDGFTAYVGRNNVENDYLTREFAAKNDLWLHARNIPGAHVIVECGGREPDDAVIEQAAALAAYYSSAAQSGRVAVDCTLARHVKKPSGARPGMVNYFNFRTISARPTLPEAHGGAPE